MSTSLALGATTAVLRALIENSVTSAGYDFSTVLGATPVISALPPDRIATGQGTPDRINLFLFQASENAAWRNRDLPSRNGNGERAANPKLALDLDYLVTAYGSTDFHADVLLGHAMFVLHETPVLTRRAIRDALAGLTPGPLADALATTHLADQFEQLRIVPRVLNVEEISKIWTALQAQYRTTAAYQVSVVLIEPARPARSALPVLTRGPFVPALGRDAGIQTQTGLLAPVPTLAELVLPQKTAARLGETLTVGGHHLGGSNLRARFRALRTGEALELPAAAGAGEAKFDVALPADPPPGPVTPDSPLNPDNWRAGIYEVAAVVTQSGIERVSNRLPLVLAPRLDSIAPQFVVGVLDSLDVTCSPKVRPTQQVVLVAGDRELLPQPFNAPTSALVFKAPVAPHALPAGTLPVRLRVDGIESLVVDRLATPPRFHPAQTVVIP